MEYKEVVRIAREDLEAINLAQRTPVYRQIRLQELNNLVKDKDYYETGAAFSSGFHMGIRLSIPEDNRGEDRGTGVELVLLRKTTPEDRTSSEWISVASEWLVGPLEARAYTLTDLDGDAYTIVFEVIEDADPLAFGNLRRVQALEGLGNMRSGFALRALEGLLRYEDLEATPTAAQRPDEALATLLGLLQQARPALDVMLRLHGTRWRQMNWLEETRVQLDAIDALNASYAETAEHRAAIDKLAERFQVTYDSWEASMLSLYYLGRVAPEAARQQSLIQFAEALCTDITDEIYDRMHGGEEALADAEARQWAAEQAEVPRTRLSEPVTLFTWSCGLQSAAVTSIPVASGESQQLPQISERIATRELRRLLHTPNAEPSEDMRYLRDVAYIVRGHLGKQGWLFFAWCVDGVPRQSYNIHLSELNKSNP
jgi:hypothetical protein